MLNETNVIGCEPVVAEHQEVSILCHELDDLGVLGSLRGLFLVYDGGLCDDVRRKLTSETPFLTMALLIELTRSSRVNTLSDSTCASEDTRCRVLRESWHTLRTCTST